MTTEEVIQYLRTWAKVNVQEVCGSPKEFIQSYRLLHELEKIEGSL